MVKSVFSKMLGVGRTTVFTVGLAMILAVVLGVATAALGAQKQSCSSERAVIVTYAPRHWTFIRRIANKEVDYDRSNTVKTLALWRNLASPERR